MVKSGEVLTFLDAHCETTPGWLEPLLYRIQDHPNVAVCPIIDIISDESFALLRSFELHHGGISWNLHFRWLGASERLMIVITSFQHLISTLRESVPSCGACYSLICNNFV
jgi:Glycosyl transferase family 2